MQSEECEPGFVVRFGRRGEGGEEVRGRWREGCARSESLDVESWCGLLRNPSSMKDGF